MERLPLPNIADLDTSTHQKYLTMDVLSPTQAPLKPTQETPTKPEPTQVQFTRVTATKKIRMKKVAAGRAGANVETEKLKEKLLDDLRKTKT